MKTLLVFLVSVCSSLLVRAQVGTLGEEVPPDFEQTNVITINSSVDEAKLPTKVDLSAKLPPAQNQSSLGVCWAFATTYALISYINNANREDFYFYLNGNPANGPDDSKIASPELPIQLYRNCKGTLSSRILEETLRKIGHISWSELPYTETCTKYPKYNIIDKAKRFASTDYSVEIIKRTDLLSLKQVLANEQPVLLSIGVDDNFHKIPRGIVGDYKPLWDSYGFTQENNGHAMTIVGYNDSIGAVKVLNSWGTQWGNNGYLWISYKILNNNARYYCYPKRTVITANLDEANKKAEKSDAFTNFSNTSTSTWFKKGYYRNFDDIRVGLSHLDEKHKFALINISDNQGKSINKFYIELKTTKQFFAESDAYTLTFDAIGRAGKNRFNKAMFFTIARSK